MTDQWYLGHREGKAKYPIADDQQSVPSCNQNDYYSSIILPRSQKVSLLLKIMHFLTFKLNLNNNTDIKLVSRFGHFIRGKLVTIRDTSLIFRKCTLFSGYTKTEKWRDFINSTKNHTLSVS